MSSLYRGPYLVLRRSKTFFVLQISEKTDSVSVHRLKPVFFSSPIVPGVPPVRGRPRLVPASNPGPPIKDHSPGKKFTFSPVKKVRFSPVPATQLRRIPHRSAPGSPPLSAVLHPHVLGGVTVAMANLTTTFLGTICSFSQPLKDEERSPRYYAL